MPSIFQDRSVASSVPDCFQNSEPPIICYKYNKPIRHTIFNFNKLVSGLGMRASAPGSWDCRGSGFVCPSASRVVAGNLKTVPDSGVRHVVSKGPKYRLSSQVDFNRCREEVSSALGGFGGRLCKRESVGCGAMKEWGLGMFCIVDGRVGFCSRCAGLLPPKPKSSFGHLRRGVQEFHRKCVLVPADRAAGSVVVVCRLHCIGALGRELNGTGACGETFMGEKSVVYSHLNEIPEKFAVDVGERQDRLPTMYWLPKLHKRPYRAVFVANSSSCTTAELSKLLTSCLTAIKAGVIKYCETVYERSRKNMFWPIKNSGEVLGGLKGMGYQAAGLSTCGFSALCAPSPHGLMRGELLGVIGRTFCVGGR